jgi:hypothetical protein
LKELAFDLGNESKAILNLSKAEGDYAVVEKPDRTTLNIRKNKLPAEAKEGDILVIEGQDIRLDLGATTKRKKKIQNLMDELWK